VAEEEAAKEADATGGRRGTAADASPFWLLLLACTTDRKGSGRPALVVEGRDM
jgi:hypothetical protein